MAEFIAGQASVFIKFGSTTLSQDYRTFSAPEDVSLVDASAGNDTNRTYLAALKDGKASIELVPQAGGTAIWNAVAPGTSGTLEWAPEGTATGKQRHYVTAIVMSREPSFPYADLPIYKVDWQFSGAVTDTVY